MNMYLASLFFLFSGSALAVEHSDFALETNGIKVEYYESSEKGIIRPSGCSQCLLEIYHFKKDVKINKDGKPIKLKEFMKDYWNAEFPTIFIDFNNNEVKRINY